MVDLKAHAIHGKLEGDWICAQGSPGPGFHVSRPPSCYHGNVSGGQSDFLTGRSRCDGRWLPGSCCPARPRSSHCHRADTHSPESPLTLFMSVEFL